jgi:hypothetical protein
VSLPSVLNILVLQGRLTAHHETHRSVIKGVKLQLTALRTFWTKNYPLDTRREKSKHYIQLLVNDFGAFETMSKRLAERMGRLSKSFLDQVEVLRNRQARTEAEMRNLKRQSAFQVDALAVIGMVTLLCSPADKQLNTTTRRVARFIHIFALVKELRKEIQQEIDLEIAGAWNPTGVT